MARRWSLSQAAITVVLALLLSEIKIATFNNITVTPQDIIDNKPSRQIEHYYSKKSKSHTSWSRAIKDAERMLLSSDLNNKNNNNNNGPISCLHPDIKASQKLAKEFQLDSTKQIAFPILNVGFPKCGSMTLYDFFVCSGYTSTHFERNRINKDFEGVCMRDAVSNGLPPVQTCTRGEQAIMQMDSEYPMGISSPWHREFRDECFFPQISILDEISKENPNTTFIMNFRPIGDWIKSVAGWNSNMLGRFQLCDFPNLPRGIPRNLSDSQEVTKVMTKFWCSHVLHLRNFIKTHPTHTLIELNLYDRDQSSEIMSSIFKGGGRKVLDDTKKCWGHSNIRNQTTATANNRRKNKNKKKNKIK